MTAAYSIGVSGMLSSQRSLDIIGNNIANANTRGYHRQIMELATRNFGLPIGDGVKIKDIVRQENSLLESAFLRNSIEFEETTAGLDNLRQIETFINPQPGSSYELLMKFFNETQQSAAAPDDLSRRRVVVATAASLAGRFNSDADELSRMSLDLDNRIAELVDQVNRTSAQIAALNESIQRGEIQGIETNDLRDERDQLIQDLAKFVDVRTIDQEYGVRSVIAAGGSVVVGTTNMELSTTTDASNNVIVTVSGSSTALTISGGQLAGVLNSRNVVVPDLQNRLDALVSEVVRQVDEIHATGVPLSGPMSLLSGEREVDNNANMLNAAGLTYPPQAGSLFVSVTDLANGQRTISEVAIDPATQSLNDLATAITAGVPNVQAIADTQTRTLRILAADGFAFDFAGRLPTVPTASAITGTSTPQISGQYNGTANDTYTYTVVGAGTVGVTAGLTLEVRDSALNLLGSFNIGQGYEPGKDLPEVNGVTVALSSGTVNAGDNFSVRTVAEPDTANILTALGLNTFFTGDSAGTLAVRSDLQADPELLAGSRSGLPGDGSNLQRLAALQDTRLLENGTMTFREYQAQTVGNLAIQVRDLSDRQTAQQILSDRLDAEIQSVSGVDTNEELVRMLQFQRSFQASARFIAAVNTAMDDLLEIV